MKEQHEALAVSVYIHAMKKQIKKEVEFKYLKRIEYLVGANNELMKELEEIKKSTKVRRFQLVDGTYYDL